MRSIRIIRGLVATTLLFVVGVVSTQGVLPVAADGSPPALSTVTQITADTLHSCALLSDGTAACWGNNSRGQLGDGTIENSNVPVAVTGGALAGKTITQIDAGYEHTCAVVSDGTAACWGANFEGQLGDGTNNSSITPVAITSGALAGKTIMQIDAGKFRTCAVVSDGSAACWGDNTYGQLGDGTTTNRNAPVAITGGALAGKTITQIDVGSYHSCAVVSDGSAVCWGDNEYGQLGDGSNSDRAVPVAVTGGALAGKTITQIDVDEYHTCALISDGTVACWGWNFSGELGDGTNTDRNVPVAVTGGALAGKTVTQIDMGSYHSCALTSDGTASCWGNDVSGQLGDGSNTNKSTPVAISGGTLAGKTVAQITAGHAHSCAVESDGTAACWGINNYGHLGDGTFFENNIPVTVIGGALTESRVSGIASGYTHSCAVLNDGAVTCWGYNGSGQLGDGTTTDHPTPAVVASGALAGKNASHLASGEQHVCAVVSDGAVAC